jgi:hypothetical protein
MAIINFDPSLLLNYYNAQTAQVLARTVPHSATSTKKTSDATANDVAPWSSNSARASSGNAAQDAKVLSLTDFIDTSNVPPAAVSDSQKLEQDNQKLFSLYNAVSNLQYLATMAGRDDTGSGVISGLNTRFQDALGQIETYLGGTSFNNFTLQKEAVGTTETGTASIGTGGFGYTGKTVTTSTDVNKPITGLSATDSFNIAVTKGGVATNVAIDLSKVPGDLTLSNILTYANQQLATAGFSTRLQRAITGSTTDKNNNITYNYGVQINDAVGENLAFNAGNTSSALYLSGTTGLTAAVGDTKADNQSRLVKLALDGSGGTTSVFSVNAAPDSGTTKAAGSVVDAQGNNYVLGTATGNVDGEINQGSQDVFLNKYDSAGKLLWSHLVGTSGSASGYGLALDPTGGVVISGSSTTNLTSTGIADGSKNDSFVAKFNADGSEKWVTQIPTLNDNAATTLSVDASGNVYFGGTVTGRLSAGATSAGKSDGYLAELNAKGKIVAENQFGTSGADSVASSTMDSAGNLYVVSIESGHAIVKKYAASGGAVDVTGTPAWSKDLGSLGGQGAIGDIAVSSSGKIYVSGTAGNGAGLSVDAGATVTGAAAGSSDAFVYSLNDNGSSAATNYVTYIGTAAKDSAGSLAVASDGTVYLTGTTSGTFDGQSRNTSGTDNAFVSALAANGSVNWTKQYGGFGGQSTGVGISLVENNSRALDALGLPTGTAQVSSFPPSLLSDNTTVKTGDTFKIQIASGSASRVATITIGSGETMTSLVNKINDEIGNAGTASTSYSSGGKSLKIESASGYALTLMAGSAGADVLDGLGLSAQTLSDGKTAVSKTSGTKTVYGLGLTSDMSFSTTTQAKVITSQLKGVLSAIQNIYQKINAPAGSTAKTPTSSASSAASSASTSYLSGVTANNSIALSILA